MELAESPSAEARSAVVLDQNKRAALAHCQAALSAQRRVVL
jgi:hypothetical protein